MASGAHLKVVQELLGHSSYGITADIYSHVAMEQQREAAERLSEVFRGEQRYCSRYCSGVRRTRYGPCRNGPH
jgi:hypothetical protein